MTELVDLDSCVFCRIVMGKEPARIVAETDTAMAFFPLRMLTLGHTLVVPKHHSVNFMDMTELDLSYTMSLAKLVVSRMQETWGIEGLNILQNNGAYGHQRVFHTHFHIVPRWAEDHMSDESWPRDHHVQDEQLDELCRQLRINPAVQVLAA